MESLELGLKNSDRKEDAVTGGGAQTGDDFSVDDLLDFSNDGALVDDEAQVKVQRKRGGDSVSQNDENTLHRSNGFSTAGEDSERLPTSELSVPMDDLAELEWLSNFVEDTFTPYSAPTKKPAWLTGDRRHPTVAPVNDPLPVQIRTKRARTGVTVWTDSSSSSSTTSSSSSPAPSSPLWLSGAEFLDEPRRKMTKKKKPSEIWMNGVETQSQTQTPTRRCGHCGVQKTPQWRAGPMGAKTLCNACGVRFKSGRLLPEYRPACSPTFSSELHSNHHRKVVEIRRKKEDI